MNAAAIQAAIKAIEQSRDLVDRMRARQPNVIWSLETYFSETHAALKGLRELEAQVGAITWIECDPAKRTFGEVLQAAPAPAQAVAVRKPNRECFDAFMKAAKDAGVTHMQQRANMSGFQCADCKKPLQQGYDCGACGSFEAEEVEDAAPAQEDATQLAGQGQELPEAVIDAVAAALGDAYDCTRTWAAWGVGTMSQDDFHPIADDGDRVAEIARAAIQAMGAAQGGTP